jgi:hypothetical protein
MAEIHTFNADLMGFADHIDAQLALVVQRVTLDLWNKVVQKTPVDTGRARSGWTVSTGQPSEFAPPEGNAAAPSAPDVSHLDGSQVVFIMNNVQYIQALEEGHSQQAPAGMLRLSIAEVEAEIQGLMP